MVNGIREFVTDNKLDVSDGQINDLAWYGLKKSDGFKVYIERLAKESGRTYDDELADYEKRVGVMQFKRVLTLTSEGKVIEDGAASNKYNIKKL